MKTYHQISNKNNFLILSAIVLFIIFTLAVLCAADQYLIAKQMLREQAAVSDNIVIDNAASKKINTYFQQSDDYLILAVGKTGTLTDGGYEPIYELPLTSSAEIAQLQYNCAVIIQTDSLDTNADYAWLPVKLPDEEQIGYVQADRVDIESLYIGQPSEEQIRNQIIHNALHYIGLRFVQYGKSLENGIDCSNFIQQIYNQSGISIANTPNDIRDQAVLIDEVYALPGDIVYYAVNNGYGHVAIYLGNGFIINSTGHAGMEYPEGGVRICRLQYMDRETYEFCQIIK